MLRLALLWVLNAIALLAVAYLLPTVRVDGIGSALLAAAIGIPGLGLYVVARALGPNPPRETP